jgi:hypothetical protein
MKVGNVANDDLLRPIQLVAFDQVPVHFEAVTAVGGFPVAFLPRDQQAMRFKHEQ